MKRIERKQERPRRGSKLGGAARAYSERVVLGESCLTVKASRWASMVGVVRPLAAGYSPNARSFLVAEPGQGVFTLKGEGAFGYPEYIATEGVFQSRSVTVPEG